MEYIVKMSGIIQKSRGYSTNGLELAVQVSFDAKQFNAIKRKSNPLAHGMAQIKNVVLDATGVRGTPSYSRPSMYQAFPRASKGLIILTVYFDISEYNATQLGVNVKDWNIYHKVDLQTTLENTRHDGHLFAKSVIAAKFAN